MSAAPTMCCRPRARRGFPPGSASTISSSAPRSSNATPGRSRALGPAAITLGEAEGLSAHARSVSIRLNRGSAGMSGEPRRAVAKAAL